MTTKFYSHRLGGKYLEVRHYADGHYVWKQFVTYAIPEWGRNYMGCTLKRAHIGTWHRVTKRWLKEVLSDYEEVKPMAVV